MLMERIAEKFRLPAGVVETIVTTAPYRYKVYEVKKKGGVGSRVIAQPAKEVKAIQRYLVGQLLDTLPLHEAATAYRKNRNIKYNAGRHVKNNFILKMDFEDFFPSLVPNDLRKHISAHMPQTFDDADLMAVMQICFWKPRKKSRARLSIGAPSSPFISNTLMFDFDTLIWTMASQAEVSYTRYADDLTFSTMQPEVLKHVETFVIETLERLNYPRLSINSAKTIHTSKKHLRRVTGLVLSSEGKVSLGRERKRLISSMVHHAIIGKLEIERQEHLRGLLAFSMDVEPTFMERLKAKYGEKKLDTILNLDSD